MDDGLPLDVEPVYRDESAGPSGKMGDKRLGDSK